MRFGPRVIGEEDFAKEKEQFEADRARAFAYGPRVTGEVAPAKQKDSETGESRSGKPKTDAQGTEGNGKHVLSVAELQKALAANPSVQLLDELIAAEFERAEGKPRKGALRLLLEAENARGDEVRPAIVKELSAALGQ